MDFLSGLVQGFAEQQERNRVNQIQQEQLNQQKQIQDMQLKKLKLENELALADQSRKQSALNEFGQWQSKNPGGDLMDALVQNPHWGMAFGVKMDDLAKLSATRQFQKSLPSMMGGAGGYEPEYRIGPTGEVSYTIKPQQYVAVEGVENGVPQKMQIPQSKLQEFNQRRMQNIPFGEAIKQTLYPQGIQASPTAPTQISGAPIIPGGPSAQFGVGREPPRPVQELPVSFIDESGQVQQGMMKEDQVQKYINAGVKIAVGKPGEAPPTISPAQVEQPPQPVTQPAAQPQPTAAKSSGAVIVDEVLNMKQKPVSPFSSSTPIANQQIGPNVSKDYVFTATAGPENEGKEIPSLITHQVKDELVARGLIKSTNPTQIQADEQKRGMGAIFDVIESRGRNIIKENEAFYDKKTGEFIDKNMLGSLFGSDVGAAATRGKLSLRTLGKQAAGRTDYSMYGGWASSALSRLSRAMGEVGALSQSDVKRVADLIPKLSSGWVENKSVFEAKMKELKTIFAKGTSTPPGTFKDNGLYNPASAADQTYINSAVSDVMQQGQTQGQKKIIRLGE